MAPGSSKRLSKKPSRAQGQGGGQRRVTRHLDDQGKPLKPGGPKRKSKESTQTTQTSEEGSSSDVYFIIPRTVTILYGPYSWQGMMDYRPERLQGLQTFLEKLGVTVNLTPCLDHVNLCRLWFLDELVWSCKLTDLVYGGDGELDPLCWQAADELENFIKKVLRGLRNQKVIREGITAEQLKKPFCPCFQVDHRDDHDQRQSVTSSKKLQSLSEAGDTTGSQLTSRRTTEEGTEKEYDKIRASIDN